MKQTLATAVVLVVGVIGLSLVFSDLGPSESEGLRLVVTAAVFTIGGFLVGRLVPKDWYLAGLSAVPPLGMGVMMVVAKIGGRYEATTAPSWTVVLTMLLGPIAASLGAAWIGANLRRSNP